ncbi:RNA-binding cell elongation regulator Jag/EloR [uncultured Ruminococcus sp.]|uniref:RNA-binding cell elongation regulator Jag/EloR n=1 Tax=uncultured Ruminococcus sp. TaxID=165186 RepID=UPI00261698D1|nr:RNA-binding cell elongation regulator Jag/EloR [uncultured Ruminococcus sp.]
MTEIFTARSIEEAKELAAKKFGRKISEIRFEIIDEGKKGLFGLGAKEAKVKATVDSVSSVQSSAPKAEPVTTAPAAEAEKPAVKAPVNEKPVVTTETKAEPKPAAEVKPAVTEAPAAEAAEEMEEEAYSLDNFTLIEDEALINPKVKLAKDYITSILRAMDVDAEFTVYQNETGAVINIESNNNGTIIGRRGETLDAIQYLCSIIANKGDKDYYRITIDCLGYRSKRKETLEQLAAKVAKSVLRTGRSQPLEPMNPYERRVIHSAISNIEGVSSRSVGEEPYRKIIISSNNPRRSGGRRDDRRGGGRRNDRRNGGERRNRDREVNMERRSVDLSTSFEKDYKRPKPEDNIEGGLYGKIEL